MGSSPKRTVSNGVAPKDAPRAKRNRYRKRLSLSRVNATGQRLARWRSCPSAPTRKTWLTLRDCPRVREACFSRTGPAPRAARGNPRPGSQGLLMRTWFGDGTLGGRHLNTVGHMHKLCMRGNELARLTNHVYELSQLLILYLKPTPTHDHL